MYVKRLPKSKVVEQKKQARDQAHYNLEIIGHRNFWVQRFNLCTTRIRPVEKHDG